MIFEFIYINKILFVFTVYMWIYVKLDTDIKNSCKKASEHVSFKFSMIVITDINFVNMLVCRAFIEKIESEIIVSISEEFSCEEMLKVLIILMILHLFCLSIKLFIFHQKLLIKIICFS